MCKLLEDELTDFVNSFLPVVTLNLLVRKREDSGQDFAAGVDLIF